MHVFVDYIVLCFLKHTCVFLCYKMWVSCWFQLSSAGVSVGVEMLQRLGWCWGGVSEWFFLSTGRWSPWHRDTQTRPSVQHYEWELFVQRRSCSHVCEYPTSVVSLIVCHFCFSFRSADMLPTGFQSVICLRFMYYCPYYIVSLTVLSCGWAAWTMPCLSVSSGFIMSAEQHSDVKQQCSILPEHRCVWLGCTELSGSWAILWLWLSCCPTTLNWESLVYG